MKKLACGASFFTAVFTLSFAGLSLASGGNQEGSFYISLGHDANHLHYKEYSGEETLNEDYGKLTGFYIALGHKSSCDIKKIKGKPFVEGYFRRYDDLITYDGATSLGAPFTFKQKQEIQRFGVKLGAYKEFLETGELSCYFDVGRRAWYRGENEVINGVLTYAEKYMWTYIGLGAGLNFEFIPKFTCGLGLEWMLALNPSARMRADLYEGGTFNLKDVQGVEVKIPLKYYFLKNTSLDLTPYFTYWDINRSDTVMISGSPYHEPDSKTHIEGLLLGLTYIF